MKNDRIILLVGIWVSLVVIFEVVGVIVMLNPEPSNGAEFNQPFANGVLNQENDFGKRGVIDVRADSDAVLDVLNVGGSSVSWDAGIGLQYIANGAGNRLVLDRVQGDTEFWFAQLATDRKDSYFESALTQVTTSGIMKIFSDNANKYRRTNSPLLQFWHLSEDTSAMMRMHNGTLRIHQGTPAYAGTIEDTIVEFKFPNIIDYHASGLRNPSNISYLDTNGDGTNFLVGENPSGIWGVTALGSGSELLIDHEADSITVNKNSLDDVGDLLFADNDGDGSQWQLLENSSGDLVARHSATGDTTMVASE